MTLRSCGSDLYLSRRRRTVGVDVDVDVLDQSTGRRPDGKKLPARVYADTTSLMLVSCRTSYLPCRNAFDSHLGIDLTAAGADLHGEARFLDSNSGIPRRSSRCDVSSVLINHYYRTMDFRS